MNILATRVPITATAHDVPLCNRLRVLTQWIQFHCAVAILDFATIVESTRGIDACLDYITYDMFPDDDLAGVGRT